MLGNLHILLSLSQYDELWITTKQKNGDALNFNTNFQYVARIEYDKDQSAEGTIWLPINFLQISLSVNTISCATKLSWNFLDQPFSLVTTRMENIHMAKSTQQGVFFFNFYPKVMSASQLDPLPSEACKATSENVCPMNATLSCKPLPQVYFRILHPSNIWSQVLQRFAWCSRRKFKR